jgi:hypothetical protein
VQTTADFKITGENQILFDGLKVWIMEGREDIDDFINDLRLYSYILGYSHMIIFKDWYPRRETVNQQIDDMVNLINNMLWKDNRYRSIPPLE